jgi:hypothetical protein
MILYLFKPLKKIENIVCSSGGNLNELLTTDY